MFAEEKTKYVMEKEKQIYSEYKKMKSEKGSKNKKNEESFKELRLYRNAVFQ